MRQIGLNFGTKPQNEDKFSLMPLISSWAEARTLQQFKCNSPVAGSWFRDIHAAEYVKWP